MTTQSVSKQVGTSTRTRTKMVHKCNKEVEMAEMHQDIKYIRKALEGNGVKGVLENVDDNTKYRIATIANGALLKFMIGGGWFTTVMVLIFTYLK